MPTSQIRQAAVGMLGAHLANSCTNFKKQHEAFCKSGFTIPITDRTRQMACCVAISGSCRARTVFFGYAKRRSLRLRPRDPIDIPKRILLTILPVSR